MKLTVFERLILLNILPPEVNATALKIVRRLREDLSFSEAEHTALQIQFGMDWERGCPRCGSEHMEYPGPEMRLSPERKCGDEGCGYEGMHGPGQPFWKMDAEKEKDVKFGKKAEQIVRDVLEKLNKQNKLKQGHWSLCEKFGVIEGGTDEE